MPEWIIIHKIEELRRAVEVDSQSETVATVRYDLLRTSADRCPFPSLQLGPKSVFHYFFEWLLSFGCNAFQFSEDIITQVHGCSHTY